MADTVEQYRAELVAQAEESVARLRSKVTKTEQQLAQTQEALVLAEDELLRVALDDLDFEPPTSHARIGL